MKAGRDTLESEARRGIEALHRGDFAAAGAAFEQVAQSGTATPQLWLLLAQARCGLDDRAAAHHALDRVLEADSRNPFALLLKGDLFTRAGDERAAVSFYRMAMASADSLPERPAALEAQLTQARSAVAAAQINYRAHLDRHFADAGIATLPPRLDEALGIASGAKQIFLQEPSSFYYPGLPQIAWYDPDAFPWVAEMEAAAEEIRAEAEGVLAGGDGIVPYVEKPKDRASRGHSLLGDKRWSAFYLWRDGTAVEEHARRCPRTMELLAAAPIPRIAGRSPMALISILEPGTHIPPHHGMLNTRLICHLPLVVPPGCRLRVGNETRAVETGKAMIFDDSIEHEAWNDGDSTRAVLLFEIWRPELGEEERAALTAMFEAIGTYPTGDG